VISCVVLDVRKKFSRDSQDPKEYNDPKLTKTNAPAEISGETIELIRYRLDETTTFGILTLSIGGKKFQAAY